MAKWYDYIPGVSNIAGVAKGDWGQALTGAAGPLAGAARQGMNEITGNDPNAIKAAYDAAMQQSKANGEQTRDFLLGQQGKAQAFYAPMQDMMKSMYGTQGIAAPQTPGAPSSTPFQSTLGAGQQPPPGGLAGMFGRGVAPHAGGR